MPSFASSGDDHAELRKALHDEAGRLIEDALFTGRNFQSAGRRWSTITNWLGVPSALLTTILAGGAGISALLESQPILTACLALSAAGLSAALGFLRPRDVSDANSLKGNRFIALRNEARMYQQIDLQSEQSVDELSARIKDLRKRYADLNEMPPLTVQRRDYLSARTSIDSGESEYAVDAKKEG